MGCSDFYRGSSSKDVFDYIRRLFNPAQADHRDADCLAGLVNQPHGYRFYGRARQPSRRTTDTGLPGVGVYTQCGVGVGYDQRVRPLALRDLCRNSNGVNIWRQLHPQRPLRRLACAARTTAAVRSGSVLYSSPPCSTLGQEMFSSYPVKPFGILQDPYHLYVVRDRVPKYVSE